MNRWKLRSPNSGPRSPTWPAGRRGTRTPRAARPAGRTSKYHRPWVCGSNFVGLFCFGLRGKTNHDLKKYMGMCLCVCLRAALLWLKGATKQIASLGDSLCFHIQPKTGFFARILEISWLFGDLVAAKTTTSNGLFWAPSASKLGQVCHAKLPASPIPLQGSMGGAGRT